MPATLGGFGVHFLHFRGRGPAPPPLLLLNGRPSSFVEDGKLAPRLADPACFGGDPAAAFDVVVPVLPGFGFSAPPRQVNAVYLLHQLMTADLGCRRHALAGLDSGVPQPVTAAASHWKLILKGG